MKIESKTPCGLFFYIVVKNIYGRYKGFLSNLCMCSANRKIILVRDLKQEELYI